MNIAEIETFLMIVKTKNITQTAENLFLTQPTVSHRLKSLEEELQIELISRKKGHKNTELTAKGEEFIPIAERWLSLWREMHMLQHGQERKFLTIGATDTLNATIFSDFYPLLLEQEHPMDLRVKTHQSYELYDLLEKHDIDVGFVYHHLHYKNVAAKTILQEKMYIIRSGVKEYKRRLHTDELDPAKEIFFSWEADYQIWHDQWLGKIAHPVIQVDSFSLINHLMRKEDMWMIAPATIVKALRDTHSVQVSEIANAAQPPKRLTYEITHKTPNAATLKSVEVLHAKLQEYLKDKNFETVEI